MKLHASRITARKKGPSTRKAQTARTTTREGFTILEVVLAMGILVVGMTSVMTLFTFGAAMARTAELRSASAGAIEAVVADLEETFFPLLENGEVGEPTAVLERPVPGVPGSVYSAIPTVNPDDPTEYRVDVEISWTTKGVRRARQLSIILLREVPFDERLRRRFAGSAG